MSSDCVKPSASLLLYVPDGCREEGERYRQLFFSRRPVNVCVVADRDAQSGEEIHRLVHAKPPLIAVAAVFSPAHEKAIMDFFRLVRSKRRDMFLITVGDEAVKPEARLVACDDNDVNMASNVEQHLCDVLGLLVEELPVGHDRALAAPEMSCGICGKSPLTARQLWAHLPTYHVNAKKAHSISEVGCPLCPHLRSREPLVVHFHDDHAPPGVITEGCRSIVQIVSFGLCVIQRKSDSKFLVVQEYSKQGYWLPGGGIDSGEFPTTAAIREAKEEAGIDVELTGILRIECTPPWFGSRHMRMRYIFFGHPVDETQPVKTFPDFESVGACWVSAEEIGSLKLRGGEPQEWFTYVASGGIIHPLSLLDREGAPPPSIHSSSSKK